MKKLLKINIFIKKNKINISNNKFLYKNSKNFENIITRFKKTFLKKGKSLLLNKYINFCIKILKKKMKNPWILIFILSKKIKINIHYTTKRIGSDTLIIPKNLDTNKNIKLGFRLFFHTAKLNKEKNLKLRLLNEFINTLQTESETIKLKKNLYKILLKNKSLIRRYSKY